MKRKTSSGKEGGKKRRSKVGFTGFFFGSEGFEGLVCMYVCMWEVEEGKWERKGRIGKEKERKGRIPMKGEERKKERDLGV